jgi:uncharacterized membrane protein YcaP (DUF421 family)
MDIVLRATVIFFFLWLITRAVGRTTLGELSSFQLILFITMGDLVQQAVTQQDYSLTGAALAVGTFAVLTIALSWLDTRFPWLRPVTHGRPIVVIRSGEPQLSTLRELRLPEHDLWAAARQQGIADLGDVELAVLEVNGRLSFFTEKTPASDGSPDQPPIG